MKYVTIDHLTLADDVIRCTEIALSAFLFAEHGSRIHFIHRQGTVPCVSQSNFLPHSGMERLSRALKGIAAIAYNAPVKLMVNKELVNTQEKASRTMTTGTARIQAHYRYLSCRVDNICQPYQAICPSVMAPALHKEIVSDLNALGEDMAGERPTLTLTFSEDSSDPQRKAVLSAVNLAVRELLPERRVTIEVRQRDDIGPDCYTLQWSKYNVAPADIQAAIDGLAIYNWTAAKPIKEDD